jgi:hypothetical protein
VVAASCFFELLDHGAVAKQVLLGRLHHAHALLAEKRHHLEGTTVCQQ